MPAVYNCCRRRSVWAPRTKLLYRSIHGTRWKKASACSKTTTYDTSQVPDADCDTSAVPDGYQFSDDNDLYLYGISQVSHNSFLLRILVDKEHFACVTVMFSQVLRRHGPHTANVAYVLNVNNVVKRHLNTTLRNHKHCGTG